MRLKIDFARKSRWPELKYCLLLLLAVLMTGEAMVQLGLAIEKQNAAENAFAAVRLKARQSRSTVSHKRVEAVNRTVMQLNLPWTALLGAVEEHLSNEVALLSLEPDASRQVLRIQAEAKSSAAMLDFVSKIAKKEIFTTVVLTRHEINESDMNKPYRFILEAQWRYPS